MQQTQQPDQAKPVVAQTEQKPVATQPVKAKPATVQEQKKPVAGQQTQPAAKPGQPEQPVKKSKWWMCVLIAVVVIGGVIWAYFQFLR